jgi:hypothetical protein
LRYRAELAYRLTIINLDKLLDYFADRGMESERPWRPPTDAGPFEPGFYLLGAGNPAVEVCVVPARRRPRLDDVRGLWRLRQGRQASPLLLIAPFTIDSRTDAHICGPTDADLTVRELGLEQAIGLAAGALAEPSGLAAVRYLHEHIPKEGQDFQGLINQGMFAAHTLRTRVPDMPEWAEAVIRGQQARVHEGRDLVDALGFSIEQTNTFVHVLRAANERARAVAIFLDRNESPDGEGGRFGDSSALSRAFTRAERDNIPFVVFTRGSEIRLYAVSGYEGVGRKGQAETYVQANVSLLADDELGFLSLIFSADALLEGGTFERILNWSRDFSADLSVRLRDRVYVEVVPALAVAIADERPETDLNEVYEQTLVVLFRLLFLAYAEDRGLLPYATNAEYRRNSLKAIARALAARLNEGKNWTAVKTHALWGNVADLFEAVDKGNDAWGVPPYNGGLFSPTKAIGEQIAGLELTDEAFAGPLAALLTEQAADGIVGPIDFRSLSVRDFGTIYEGLLESSLSAARDDLSLDERGNYVPAEDGTEVVVRAGEIYFHNRSGKRKSSASYFTKDFAVEHLLDRALGPALTAHLDRLGTLVAAGHEEAAAAAFFDFRCADLAMGSGHFLVAAVDHIERRLAQFIDEHPLAAVEAELDRLRLAAIGQLGDTAAGYEIERRQLLRRQVARRCIYGVDRNALAVDLARLSLWVHTFVPGLPLSFLDHNLVEGDSLTGIGTIKEAVDFLSDLVIDKKSRHGQVNIFEELIDATLRQTEEPLRRLGRASDATRDELTEVRRAQEEALERAEPARKLFDLVCAMRRGEVAPFSMGVTLEEIERHPELEKAEAAAEMFGSLHFPIAFPEVFLRDRVGFDCVVGNPPWDKVMFEPQQFWVTRSPGLNNLSPAERDARIDKLRELFPEEAEDEDYERQRREAFQAHISASFLHQGRGHYDYAKLFVERAAALMTDGRLGYVLPRQCLVLGGWAKLRALMLDQSRLEVVQARNRGGWLFDDVHNSYMVVLLDRAPAGPSDPLCGGARVWPVVRSRAEVAAIEQRPSIALPRAEIAELSDSHVLPWLDSPAAAEVFDAMRSRPTVSSGDGWITGIHDARWDFRRSGPHGPFARKAARPASWRILMTRHVEPYRIVETIPFVTYVDDLAALAAKTLGIVFDTGKPKLGSDHPLIVFRHPSRNDDSRTLRAAALPEAGTLHNKGYVHGFRHEPGTSGEDLLALLCFFNTYTCDWWARRFVDRHVTAPVINNLRLPDWSEEQRTLAADVARALLRRHGATVLAGGVDLSEPGDFDDLTDDELFVTAESLAMRGFSIVGPLVEVVLDDFSDNGLPQVRRNLIVEQVRAQT